MCREILPRTEYDGSQWEHRLQRNATCIHYLPPDVVPTFRCKVFKKILPRTAYHESQWYHRQAQNASCRDCLQPKCTNPDCRTCPSCHNSQCKVQSMQCAKVFDHTRSTLPQNEEELARWSCPTCVFTYCQVCRKEPNTTKAPSRRLTHRKRWTCVDCLQSALQEKKKKAPMSCVLILIKCGKSSTTPAL